MVMEESRLMGEKIFYFINNFGYMFAKFFFLLIWAYMTLVIVFGGEWKIMIGDNSLGIKFGFEGIIPSAMRWTRTIKSFF